jgi:hypothetical protein
MRVLHRLKYIATGAISGVGPYFFAFSLQERR